MILIVVRMDGFAAMILIYDIEYIVQHVNLHLQYSHKGLQEVKQPKEILANPQMSFKCRCLYDYFVLISSHPVQSDY